MDAIMNGKKNVIISSLVFISFVFVCMIAFLWLKLNNSNTDRQYLSYLVGKQRELEKLLVLENKILREKARVPKDQVVIVSKKQKAPGKDKRFLFKKSTPKVEVAVSMEKEKTPTGGNRGFLFRKGTSQ